MIDLLRSRRSIRSYDDRPVERDRQALLEEALLRAPTSHNKRPWSFFFVEDRAALRALSRTKPHGSSFLAGAPLAIVICGDPTISDMWVEDCSIAATFVQLTAHAIGLGSCWIQVRNRPHDDDTPASGYVKRQLDLPSQLEVEAIIGVGYPAEEKPGRPREELLWDRINRPPGPA
jgi:nitroreductase